MEIKLKKIIIEGFGSIHDSTEFKLDRPGFNIIQAKNGAGKSSIINAVTWVFWGKAIKATTISTWPKYRGKNYKGVKVDIYFELDGKQYRVIRCKDYKGIIPETGNKGDNGLFIINGDKVEQSALRDKADIKKKVQDLVGYSFDLFKNSVVFGQKAQRIISESGPRQKEILEQAFEVGYINKAHEMEKVDLKIIHKEYVGEVMTLQKQEADLESLKKILNLMREQKASFETNKADKLGILQKQLDGIKENIRNKERAIKASKGTKSSIQALESKLELYTNAKNAYNILENQEFKLSNEIDTLQDKAQVCLKKEEGIKGKISEGNSVCDVCGSILNKAGKIAQKERYKKEYNELKNEYLRLTVELSPKIKAQSDLIVKMREESNKFTDAGQFEKQLKSLRMGYKPIKELQEDYEQLQRERVSVVGNMDMISTQKNPVRLKPKLKEKVNLKEEIKVQKLRVKKLRRKVDIKEWLITDALSNKGLKAYIFQSMLGAINNRLAKYAKYIGFKAAITIDMASANKNVQIKVFLGEDEVPVADLSGGQCQLIDIAISFSIHDVISIDKICNVLFMDEVFESLDVENVELVTEIIQKKSRGLSLFLITHHNNFNVTGSNIIRLKLNKQFHTVIAE